MNKFENLLTKYHRKLKFNEHGAMAYVLSRRIGRQVIKQQQLLYFPYSEKIEYIKGFNAPQYFNGYIVCPIFHPDNKKIISFTSRNYDNPLHSAPKHKHYPGKQDYMLGQFFVRKDFDEVFLVEGLFDYLSAKTLNLNTLGILGVSNFKESHIDFILEHFNTIYVMLDNDEGGNKAAEDYVKKIHRRARKQLKEVSVFRVVPPVKDLNQWLVEGCTLTDIYKLCNDVIEERPAKEKREKKEDKEHTLKDTKEKYTTKELLSLARKVGEVQPSGTGWKMNCVSPDHKDDTASLHIYPNNKGLYCFGCGLRYPQEFIKYAKELVNK